MFERGYLVLYYNILVINKTSDYTFKRFPPELCILLHHQGNSSPLYLKQEKVNTYGK